MKNKKQPNLKKEQIIGRFIKNNYPDGVSAEELVLAATPKNSPIHQFFDWNNKTAAHKYRLHQARQYIVALRVEFMERETKAYHSVYVENLDERRYMPIRKIHAQQNLMDQVVEAALKNLTYWRDRYGEYKEFRNVTLEINKVERKYHGKA